MLAHEAASLFFLIYCMKKSKLIVCLGYFIFGYLIPVSYGGTNAKTLTDEGIQKFARTNPAFDSVVNLKKTIKICGYSIDIPSASATHIGGGFFLMAGHCAIVWEKIDEWLKFVGLKSSPVCWVKLDDQLFKVKALKIHPEYVRNKERSCDLAIFYAPKAAKKFFSTQLSSKDPKTLPFEKILTTVGFGISGGAEATFSWRDDKRRAVRSKFSSIVIGKGDWAMLASGLVGVFEEAKFIERPRIDYEAGTRQGMCGGGVFSCDEDNKEKVSLSEISKNKYELIGLHVSTWHSEEEYSMWFHLKRKLTFLTMLLPVPVIGVLPKKNSASGDIALHYHRQFIQDFISLQSKKNV